VVSKCFVSRSAVSAVTLRSSLTISVIWFVGKSIRISKIGAKADCKGPLARGRVLCFPHFAIVLAEPQASLAQLLDHLPPIKNAGSWVGHHREISAVPLDAA
jgi:hypothetical protein